MKAIGRGADGRNLGLAENSAREESKTARRAYSGWPAHATAEHRMRDIDAGGEPA